MTLRFTAFFKAPSRKAKGLPEHFEWDVGTSAALLAELRMDVPAPRNMAPIDAYAKARAFAGELSTDLRSKYGPYTESGTRLRGLVAELHISFRWLNQRNAIPLKSLPRSGMALIGLVRSQQPYTAGGCNYNESQVRTGIWMAQRAGVLVWDAGSAFVYDPHRGGAHFSYTGTPASVVPCAVDVALHKMDAQAGMDVQCFGTQLTWIAELNPDILSSAYRAAFYTTAV